MLDHRCLQRTVFARKSSAVRDTPSRNSVLKNYRGFESLRPCNKTDKFFISSLLGVSKTSILQCKATQDVVETDDYRTIVQGRNVKLTEALKSFAEEKLSKALNKYGTAIKEVDINLSVSGGNRGRGDEKQKCEITIFLYRLGLVRAEDVEENMYAAIEKVTDIVSRKMRKVKEKAIAKGKWDGSAAPRGHSAYKELPEEVSLSDTDEEIDLDAPAPSFPPEVIRTKILGLTKTSTEDALEQVEQLGHAFYIFRDTDDKLKILYKRKFSGYGVIVPQFL